MENLSFYNVPSAYVNYLRDFETNIRGFSHVPLVDYELHNRKGKFFCGIVLQINDHQYYVPVSSNIRNHQNTFYLYQRGRRISSLRFDYMFPVPQEIISVYDLSKEPDRNYVALVDEELSICRSNAPIIRKMAFQTYIELAAPERNLTVERREHSCDFRLLEGACDIYRQEHGLTVEPLEPSVAMLRNQQPRTLDEIIASATAKAEQINRQTDPVLPQKEKAITHD